MTPSTYGAMRVAEIWRYPVKSLRGEMLDETGLTSGGIPGDRVVHVSGPRGLLTGRTRHELLTLPARTGADGEPIVGGHPWDSPQAAAQIAAAAGPDARLVRDSAPERFDVLPLLVATDTEIARLGVDRRRLRPNLVIAGVAEGAERHWPGHALRIGTTLIGMLSLRDRCIVTTIDPDSGAQDLEVLRRIRREFDGSVALDCWVLAEGAVHVGDPVEVVPLPRRLPAHGQPRPGGWVTGRPYPARPAATQLSDSESGVPNGKGSSWFHASRPLLRPPDPVHVRGAG
jgi:hypothetical protein